MSHAVSPLAPKSYPDMPAIDGVRMATAEAGIKYKNRTDVLMMVFDQPATVAGVFTRSKCPSAPVDFCRSNLAAGKARAVVVNSGNANAFTGKKGREATALTAESAAKAVGCATSDVFLASTGVIGVPLPVERILGALGSVVRRLGPGVRPGAQAARAIMTTDTRPKQHAVRVRVGSRTYVVGAMAKGAGMIHPQMATLLGVITTDAPLAPAQAQRLLASARDNRGAIKQQSSDPPLSIRAAGRNV